MSGLSHIPEEVREILATTRYGISFPYPGICQMRFVHNGVDLGGSYPYSVYDGVVGAVNAAVADNVALREKYRCRPDGKRAYRIHRKPHGTTGVVGGSCGPYIDSRRGIEAFRYQVHWRKESARRARTFHLSQDASADQHLHAFRTAIQFRKEWEALLDGFDPTRYKLWRTHRLYEPGQPALPPSFWGANTIEEY